MSEYEKKLEARIAELEQMLDDALKPKHEKLAIQKEPFDMSYDGWKLVGLYDYPQSVSLHTNLWIIMILKKKKLFGGYKKLEFNVRASGDDFYLGNREMVVNKYHKQIISNIWTKCCASGFIEREISAKGELTEAMYVTNKWKEISGKK